MVFRWNFQKSDPHESKHNGSLFRCGGAAGLGGTTLHFAKYSRANQKTIALPNEADTKNISTART